jgi:hypothetical protein
MKKTEITRLILNKGRSSCVCFTFKHRAGLPGISKCYPGQGGPFGVSRAESQMFRKGPT